jgi:3-phosphoglycerate kinase
LCKEIISQAEDNHTKILFPQDYQIASHSIDGSLSFTTTPLIPDNAAGISIGQKTIEFFAHEIDNAQTIFFNGAMGFAQRPETRQTTYQLLHLLAQAHGTTYIAGGDTIEATFTAGVAHNIDYLSTGGGAALAYLGGNQLPGLIPFEEY